MSLTPITIESIVTRWQSLDRPLFKGCLIDESGCKCAQGDVLSVAGYSDDELRVMKQSQADIENSRILSISITHAVLLRHINDSLGGAPQLVLSNPEEIIGPKAPIILAFWKYIDTPAAWDAWDAWDAQIATEEIVGMDILEAEGAQPLALAVWGFDTWDKVRALARPKPE